MSTLHDDLTALSADQPAQPADRLSSVTGRARRLRRNRALAGGLAALVAVGSVAGLLRADRRPQPPQLAATGVASWPDRSQPGAARLGAGAIAQVVAAGAVVEDVRYLYRGLLELPDRTTYAVVVATAKVDLAPTLLTLGADRDQITALGDAKTPDNPTPWYVDSEPYTGTGPSHVGLVVRSSAAGRSTLFSLDPPAARSLQWRQVPLPHADVVEPAPALTGSAASGNGVFTTALPGLIGPVRVTISDSRTTLPEQDLTDTSPELAAPPLPAYGRRDDENGGGGGPGTSSPDVGRPGRWILTNLGVAATEGPHFRLYVRCYGGGTQTYTLKSYSDEKLLATGSVACDGQTGQAIAYDHLPKAGFYLGGSGDRLQGYDYRYLTWP